MSKIKFKTEVTSLMRSGAVEGNALRIDERKGVIALEVCYSMDSTARGYIGIPADKNTLRSIAKELETIAAKIESAEDEPDEVINEYEPDEMVKPEVLDPRPSSFTGEQGLNEDPFWGATGSTGPSEPEEEPEAEKQPFVESTEPTDSEEPTEDTEKSE